MVAQSERRGMAVFSGPNNPPVTGPYAEQWWDAAGEYCPHRARVVPCWRIRLTDEGRAKCAELLAAFGDRPMRLLPSVGMLRGVHQRAVAIGLDDDELNALCLEAAARAVARFQPGRGAELATTLPESIRGEFASFFCRHERTDREFSDADYELHLAVIDISGKGENLTTSNRPTWAESREPDPAELLTRAEEAAAARAKVDTLAARGELTERERQVIALRFGDTPAKRGDVADALGIHRVRVRDLELSGLAKLKSAAGVTVLVGERDRARVLASLANHGTDGLSRKALMTKRRCGPIGLKRLAVALRDLQRTGEVEKVGHGSNCVYRSCAVGVAA